MNKYFVTQMSQFRRRGYGWMRC